MQPQMIIPVKMYITGQKIVKSSLISLSTMSISVILSRRLTFRAQAQPPSGTLK
jgi:hypothetical protein